MFSNSDKVTYCNEDLSLMQNSGQYCVEALTRVYILVSPLHSPT